MYMRLQLLRQYSEYVTGIFPQITPINKSLLSQHSPFSIRRNLHLRHHIKVYIGVEVEKLKPKGMALSCRHYTIVGVGVQMKAPHKQEVVSDRMCVCVWCVFLYELSDVIDHNSLHIYDVIFSLLRIEQQIANATKFITCFFLWEFYLIFFETPVYFMCKT